MVGPMWIVRLALKRPYTFLVMAALMLIFGLGSITKMSTDIFPDIDIPVVSVIWTYSGLPADEMERRITTYSEYGLSNNVNDIRSIESQTYDGVSVIRLYFHPGVKIESAIAQATASSQSIIRRMPSGVLPPTILRYTAASVPILQLSLASQSLSETELYDYGMYQVRRALGVVRGSTLPTPYGGKQRQIRVDLKPERMQAMNISPRDVNDALNLQNLALPSGNARVGDVDYRVQINNSPSLSEGIGDLPVRNENGRIVYIRDLANVHDGNAWQTNVVRNEGQRSVLLPILKNGSASTLDVVNQIKDLLPSMRAAAPPGMLIQPLFDQSVFVKAAVDNVLHEGAIAGVLTGAMILLFLGSWRSTVIVLLSIPLSILTSLVCLLAMGNSLNIMTLGGLALAIGILVDDSTVTIENIHRNLSMGKGLVRGILDGAEQIATPAFVATTCICIVFLPVALLEGPALYLFVPFAQAVVFAVATSYLLSRTLVPVLVHRLLAAELAMHDQPGHKKNLFERVNVWFLAGFERFQERYARALQWGLRQPSRILIPALLLVGSSLALAPFVGRDFFPVVDAGQIRLHVKGPAGTRIEKTEEIFSRVEAEIRKVIPPEEIELLNDNIGVPAESYNLAFGDSATIGTADGEILIALKPNRRKPTPEYLRLTRDHLNKTFPNLTFYFQPADIVSQILNFGLPAPIDIRVSGFKRAENLELARQMVKELEAIPGAVDVHLHQEVDAPTIKLEADRTLLSKSGLTQRDLANDMLITLSSNTQVTPNYWVDPKAGIPYFVAIQTPPYVLDSPEALLNTPISSKDGQQLLRNVAQMQRGVSNTIINHLNIQPVYDIFLNVQSRDLGAVAGEVQKIVNKYKAKQSPGNRIEVRGMVESLNSAFARLGLGFVGALVLIYLLLVVNYQSLADAAIIVAALPGAAAGVIWALFITHSTFNVPSLMGSIMSLGVATANSVLMVSFAKEKMMEGEDSFSAALEAGRTRLRPVLMTAMAMVLGMIPMSLALGQGSEQNAPLGRAVIGGLSVATLFTLFFVPAVFSLVRRKGLEKPLELDEE